MRGEIICRFCTVYVQSSVTWQNYEDYMTSDMKMRAELDRMKNIESIMETKESTDYEG